MIRDNNILDELEKNLKLLRIHERTNSDGGLEIESKELSKILLNISKATFSLTPLESSESNSLIDSLQSFVCPNAKHTKYSIQILGNISKGAKLPTLIKINSFLKDILVKSSIPLNIAAAYKSMAFLINENAKLANENISLLIPLLLRSIFNEGSLSIIDSETDWSEIESNDNSKHRVRKLIPEWKIQYQALFCLEALGNQCSKQLCHHLKQFIPEDSKNVCSLLYIIQYHKSEHIRGMACRAVVAILKDSKQYLSIAANTPKATSFTSLSQQIANQLLAIIEALFNAFQSSINIPIFPDLCEVFKVVLVNSNLKNLDNSLDNRMLKLLADCLENSTLKNYLHLLLDCLSKLVEHLKDNSPLQTSALSITLSFADRTDSLVQISILSVLASISNDNPSIIRQANYFIIIYSENWKSNILPIILSGIKSNIPAINFSALKVIEHFAHSANSSNLILDENWWIYILEMTAHLWTESAYNIRCISCNLISHISKNIFNSLETRLVSLLIKTALAYTQDDHVDVRAASCGTLGVYIGFRQSSIIMKNFIHDSSIRLIGLCDDTSLKVRIRAFWALGALADALQNPEPEGSIDQQVTGLFTKKDIVFDLEDSILLSLLQVSIAGCSDHEKVRYHAFRALGRLAPGIPHKMMHASINILNQAMACLISNLSSGAFKTRWNATHCIRNMIACDGFPLGKTAPYSENLWPALVDVALNSTNFKVKTGAVLALSTPKSVERYESSQKSSVEMIAFIIEGLKKITGSCVLDSSSSIEAQNHIFLFLDTLKTCLFQIKSSVSSSWTSYMETDLKETVGIINKIQTAEKIVEYAFDPTAD